MKLVFNGTILFVLMFFATSSSANDNLAQPGFTSTSRFITSVKTLDGEKSANTPKVCACQIIQIQAKNQNAEKIAVFAEKNSYGDVSQEEKIATEVLNKERKTMRQLFFSNLKVLQTLVAPTDCRTLYKRIRNADLDVKMYDIVDADIRRAARL